MYIHTKLSNVLPDVAVLMIAFDWLTIRVSKEAAGLKGEQRVTFVVAEEIVAAGDNVEIALVAGKDRSSAVAVA